jgi:hypothetical protein
VLSHVADALTVTELGQELALALLLSFYLLQNGYGEKSMEWHEKNWKLED